MTFIYLYCIIYLTHLTYILSYMLSRIPHAFIGVLLKFAEIGISLWIKFQILISIVFDPSKTTVEFMINFCLACLVAIAYPIMAKTQDFKNKLAQLLR